MGEVLGQWSAKVVESCRGRQIAIDGKTLRRSFEHAWKKMGLHVVTACCVDDALVLCQTAVDEKENEITAVPKLLDMLDLEGAVVTVDALNTQKTTAARITGAGGDCVMAVKDNHPALHERITVNMDDLIRDKFPDTAHTIDDTTEGGHGRIDRRVVYATESTGFLTRQQRDDWPGIKSVVVDSTRKLRDKTEKFRRCYISSLPADAAELGRLIRGHWGIENGQHWCLDTGFREDDSRVRAGHGDENLAAVRRIALNLLKQDKSCKLGIHNKRLKAAGNNGYLMKIVTGTSNPK
jgi:predicted transposase YbfD/YdcC